MGSRVRSSLGECEHFLKLDPPEYRTGQQNRLRRNGRWKNRNRSISHASKGLKAERAKYQKLSYVFLHQLENKWCVCCTLRQTVLGEDILINYSSEVHHWAGRIKKLLCYVPYFRAFCYHCREWPHLNKIKARELGLLAPAHLWEVYPSDY